LQAINAELSKGAAVNDEDIINGTPSILPFGDYINGASSSTPLRDRDNNHPHKDASASRFSAIGVGQVGVVQSQEKRGIY
jgi:hypothetical protein